MIYLDMDGVVADFDKGAIKELGFRMDDPRMPDPEKWKIVNQNSRFWVDLDPMPNAHKLWAAVKQFNPHFLTAAPKPSNGNFQHCKDGKTAWLKKHFNVSPDRIHVVLRSEKVQFAMNGDTANILIDDLQKNILEFNHGGGIGILYDDAHYQRALQRLAGALGTKVRG